MRTIFFTLASLIAILGAIHVPSLWPRIVMSSTFTSGCCKRTSRAFSASCCSCWYVVSVTTPSSKIVPFRPIPLLLYRSTAMPLSERYSAICRKGLEGSSVPVTSGGRYSSISVFPEPWTRRTPGKGPSPTEGRVSCASVVTPSPRFITRSLRTIVSSSHSASSAPTNIRQGVENEVVSNSKKIADSVALLIVLFTKNIR